MLLELDSELELLELLELVSLEFVSALANYDSAVSS